MSENKQHRGRGELEQQQALLRRTINLNEELIAEADRMIASSRKAAPNKPPHSAN